LPADTDQIQISLQTHSLYATIIGKWIKIQCRPTTAPDLAAMSASSQVDRYKSELTDENKIRIQQKQVPETTSIVRVFSFCQLLREHHLLAVSQLLHVVRHPCYRLAVTNSDICVIFQPRVRLLQQLTSIGVKNTILTLYCILYQI